MKAEYKTKLPLSLDHDFYKMFKKWQKKIPPILNIL